MYGCRYAVTREAGCLRVSTCACCSRVSSVMMRRRVGRDISRLRYSRLAKQDVCEFRRFVCVVQMFQVVDLCELLKGFNCCDEASFTYGYQDY